MSMLGEVAPLQLRRVFSPFQCHGRGAGVGRALGVGAILGVGVGLAVAVGVAVAVAVAVGVAVAIAVAVAVGVAVTVAVGVGVAVGVAVAVGVGVAVPCGLHLPALPALTMAWISEAESARLKYSTSSTRPWKKRVGDPPPHAIPMCTSRELLTGSEVELTTFCSSPSSYI